MFTINAKKVVVQLSRTTRLHSHWEPNQTRHIPAQVGKRLQQLPAPTDYTKEVHKGPSSTSTVIWGHWPCGIFG